MSEPQINEAAAAEPVSAAPASEPAPEQVTEQISEPLTAQAPQPADVPAAEVAAEVVAEPVAEQVEEAPQSAEALQVEETTQAEAPKVEEAPKPEKAPKAPKAEKPAAEQPAPEQPATEQAGSGDEAGDGDTPVVRMLSVNQQVKGTVKRITEFGAFVDIGVGRDGLVHISELSTKRVGKVNDVLQEGQQVDLWIKKLDRERNRISLTMIEPGKRTIRDLQKGEVIEGTVTRLLPYGAFIDIGIGRDALLHVREMGEGYIAKPEDVVKVGDMVEVRVIEIARRRSRVDLSMKGLRPEPEAPAAAPSDATPEAQPAPEPEPEMVDEFANVEVLTPMQLAFKRAQEKSGVVLPMTTKAGGKKRAPSGKGRAEQEDIFARTLSTGVNTTTGKK